MELSLLKKYFENRCSPEEAEAIQAWIESKSAASDMEENFKAAWENIKVKPGDYQKWSGMLHKVHEKIDMEELYASLSISENERANSKISGDRGPIRIHETESKSVKQRSSYIFGSLFILVFFIVSILGYINYPFASEQLFIVEEVTKITEPGQKLSFHLNDGSRVILNAGSKLMYPETFNEQERIVHLEGEAFFEVSKDSQRPFRVFSGSVVTTALGTSFNISSYPTENAILVALVTGSVMVSEDENSADNLFLMPGEMATFQKEDNRFTKTEYTFKEMISWKDGFLNFKDAGYAEIVRKLELWYGVDIIENRIPEKTWSFTGTFENENLDNILNSLQFGHGFQYEIVGKKVELKF